jgi:undecaprenyl diphosphate synthase
MADIRAQSSPVPHLSSPVDRLPSHVAIIMDGNGRWAKQSGLPRIAGHRRGVETVRKMVRSCAELGVPYLTLFAFSSENWRRPATEVRLLMELLSTALENEIKQLQENDVRLRVIGDLSRFSNRVTKLISAAEADTANNTRLTLTIAANYGGRWDIAHAFQRIASRIVEGELQVKDITEQLIQQSVSTADLPEPDLFIRTGGEKRISNFLLWQLAYTELYFSDVLWPDFDDREFGRALASFAERQRRFGRTGEQVTGKQAQNA